MNRKELGAQGHCQFPPALFGAPFEYPRGRIWSSSTHQFPELFLIDACSAFTCRDPSRFGGTRKRSVPLRVHSVLRVLVSSGVLSGGPDVQPVFDSRHGRITCKTFPLEQIIALGSNGARPFPISSEGSKPNPFHWLTVALLNSTLHLMVAGWPKTRLAS